MLASYKPTSSRRYWKHSIVYLDYPKVRYVGTKQELDEAIGEPFESYKDMKRLA